MKKFVATFLLLAALATGLFIWISPKGKSAEASNHAVVASDTDSTPQEKIVDTSTMSDEIQSIIDENPSLQIAVAITDLTNGKTYSVGTTAGFKAASITKLITAAAYLHLTEKGDLSLTQTISVISANTLLQRMIVNSDNTSWHTLNTKITSNTLEDYAAQIGITSYSADTNTIKAEDINILLSKLYSKDLLNDENTDLLLSYMKNSTQTNYIVDNASSYSTVYHKAGWLEDRVHDTAIIDDGSHPYALTIFTKSTGAYDAAAGQAIFKAITDSTIKAFITSQQ